MHEYICHFKISFDGSTCLNLLPIKKKMSCLIIELQELFTYTSPLWIYVLQMFSPIYMLCGGILRTERLQLRRAGGAPRLESFILKSLVFQEPLLLPDLPWALSHSNEMETSQCSLTALVLGPLYITPCSGKHHLATIHTFSSSP